MNTSIFVSVALFSHCSFLLTFFFFMFQQWTQKLNIFHYQAFFKTSSGARGRNKPPPDDAAPHPPVSHSPKFSGSEKNSGTSAPSIPIIHSRTSRSLGKAGSRGRCKFPVTTLFYVCMCVCVCARRTSKGRGTQINVREDVNTRRNIDFRWTILFSDAEIILSGRIRPDDSSSDNIWQLLNILLKIIYLLLNIFKALYKNKK